MNNTNLNWYGSTLCVCTMLYQYDIYNTVTLQLHHNPHCLSLHLPSKRCYCCISPENVKLFNNNMLQHCNCIMEKGRCVCVCVGGGGLQFCIFFIYFPLFWHDFSLKPCQFSLSYHVFFLQLYSISGNASYDK